MKRARWLLQKTTQGKRRSALFSAHVIFGIPAASITALASILGQQTGNPGWENGVRAGLMTWAGAVLLSTLWTLGVARPRLRLNPSMLGQRLVAVGRFFRGAGLLALGAWVGIYVQRTGEYLAKSQGGSATSTYWQDLQSSVSALGLTVKIFIPFAALYVGFVLTTDLFRVGDVGRARAAGCVRFILGLMPQRFSKSWLARMAPYWVYELNDPVAAGIASFAYMFVSLGVGFN